MTARPQPLALTAGQAAIWLAQQLDPASPAFNTCTSIVVDGDVSQRQVAAAWRQVVEATPALRLRVGIDEWTGELQQWFASARNEIQWDDAEQRADGQDPDLLLDEAVRAPYPVIEPGSLTRLHASRIAPGRVRLSSLAHHVTVDGICQSAIARRLAGGLHGDCALQPEHHYVSLLDQVRAAEAQARADHSVYWRERLTVSGPVERPRWLSEHPAAGSPDGSTRRPVVAAQMALEPALAQRLDHVAELLGCTPFYILLVGCHLLLWRRGAATSFVSTAVSVRPQGANTDIVGCFIDQVPLRATLDGTDSLADTVRRDVPLWRQDLKRRALPFIDLVRFTRSAGAHSVALDDLLMTYRRADGAETWSEGPFHVTAEFFRPYPAAMTAVLIRFVHAPRSVLMQLTCSEAIASSVSPATLLSELAAYVTGVLRDPYAPFSQSPRPSAR